MDKYQKRAKEMKEEELIAIAKSNDQGDKLLAGLAWFGGASVVLGLLLSLKIGDIAFLFVFCGILLVAICAPLAVYCKKLGQAAAEEVGTRGLKAKVIEQQTKEAREREAKRAENKAFGTFLLITFILVALIIFGIRGCMGMGTVSCPKCGSTYSTDHPAGEYIESHGVCARCD